jgi:hypothetical protein
LKKWNNSTKYVGSVAKQLNGRLSFFKRAGRFSTWYIPAALGMISVVTAPPELRLWTLFEEGFGVLGGAAGTYAGTALGGLVAISILGLGPFGLFVMVFICASVVGMVGMKVGNKIGTGIYDLGIQSGAGQIYYSPQKYLEQIQ